MSATSLGILAVFDRLCETGLGRQSTKFTIRDMVDFWQQIIFVRSRFAGRVARTSKRTSHIQMWLMVVASSVRVAIHVYYKWLCFDRTN